MEYSDPSTPAELADQLPDGPVGLADPARPDLPRRAGEIVLGIGIGPDQALVLVRAAATARVAAVVLRPAEPATTRAVARLAGDLGVRLAWLAPESTWDELHRVLTDRAQPPPTTPDEELVDLAQTIATLTGGLVTIEDTASRVLAYSTSSDEVDDLRRLSILGRSGPADYLALLREWGVYDRLAGSEEVVEIAEHAESGVRRRLAVGVFGGDRQLGTIWVQQGSADFGPHARQALLGAARLAAVLLAGRGPRRHAAGVLTTLLTGTDREVARARAELGRAGRQPCLVAVFALGDDTVGPADARLRLDELTAIVTVQATALRRDARAEQLEGRVCLLVPNVTSAAIALPTVRDLVAAAREHIDAEVRAGLGTIVETPVAAGDSRRAADLALTVRRKETVVTFAEARPRLLTRSIENHVAQQAELLDPRLAALIDDDRDSARTVLEYLDNGSDVARVSDALGVHATTVRYRLRRTVAALGLDLSDGDDRLSAQLQLRCGLRTSEDAG